MDIYNSVWTEADSSNSTAAPDGAPEGMSPSGINNVLRAHQGAIKRYVNQQSPKTTAGTSTTYTLTYDVAPGALVDGQTHLVQFNATCGASPTLNVNSLGAIPLHYLSNGTWVVVPSGGILANTVAKVAYNSSAGTYRIVSSSAAIPPMAQSINTDGYTTIPGGGTGIRLQWGLTVINSGTTGGVTFPTPFASTPYSIQITEGANNTQPGSVTSPTAANFQLGNPGSVNSAYFWFAIGPA